MSMIQEVDTIELAWSRIKEWSQAYAETATDTDVVNGRESFFLGRLNRSLECGTLVMSALQDDLAEFVDSDANLNFRQRCR